MTRKKKRGAVSQTQMDESGVINALQSLTVFKKFSTGPKKNLTVRIPIKMLAALDEMSAAIGWERNEVLFAILDKGLQQLDEDLKRADVNINR